MELSPSVLDVIIRANPGDFALYRLDGGRLATLFSSPGMPAICGMSAEEYGAATAQDAADIVFERDRPRITALLGRFAQGTPELELTYRLRHKTRGAVWVHAQARSIGTLDGCTVLMVVFLDNSREAEEYDLLLNNTAACIYVIDRSTHELLYANEPSLREWGHGDYSGQPCYRYVNGLDGVCPWCSVPQMKDGCAHADENYVSSIGRWFRVDCRAMNWFGRDAAAIYALDVTEQKKQRLSLEFDKKGLEQLVENTPIGIGVFSAAGGGITPLAVNDRFSEFLGTDKNAGAAGMGPKLLGFIHPDDRPALLDTMRRLKTPGTNLKQAFRYSREGGGTYQWYQLEARTASLDGNAAIFVCLSDVTQEKEFLTELNRNRRMYEAAASLSGLSVWDYDIRSRRITLSDSSATQSDRNEFGIPKVIENVPESIAQWVDERDLEKCFAMYRAIADGAPYASCEYWYKSTPGQKPRCERALYTTVFDEDGNPVSAYGIGQDITAQKLEKENYSRIYRQLAEANPNATGSFRFNLTTNWCGDGQSPYPFVLALQDSGTADGFLGALAESVTDPDIRADLRRHFCCNSLIEAFRSGKKQLTIEYPTLSSRGSLHWIRGTLTMLQNPDTGDVEAIAYATDITRQKRYENIIARITEEKFDYVGVIDLKTNALEFVNIRGDSDYGELHTKARYEEGQRHMAEHFIAPMDRTDYLRDTSLTTVLSALESAGEYACTYQHQGRDGATRRLIQYSWLDRDRGVILIIRSDITAAYRQEQEQLRQLQEALLAAERANSAKTEFVSRISHDIRTPISIISSMTDFALEDLQNSEKLRQDLARIKTSNIFLLSLINDVLDISKIDSGKIELHPEPYPCAEYFANIRNMAEPLCQQKGLSFSMETEALSLAAVVDHIRLNQITFNLLSNAIKYTPPGGKIVFRAESEKLPDGLARCCFEVRDTGIGMSPEFQKIMFEPFTQEYDNPKRERTESGTGLGLSIVRRIVDLMGGTIEVRSAPGRGTDILVRFVLPCAAGTNGAGAGDGGPSSPAARGGLHGRVLLAEDNPINTEIAVRILTGFGLEVKAAENGDAAVKQFASAPPGEFGAVLLDIQMPVLNGYEAAERIRSLPRPDAASIPIIAMTADAFADAMERSRKAGMNAYVTKPLDPGILRKTLENLLDAQ